MLHSRNTYTYIHAETKSTIMTNEHTSLEKYTSHFMRNGCERVMCERWVGDWTNCNMLTPSSFVFSSTSFSFCWAAQSGVLRAHSPLLGAGSYYSILSPTKWLQLTEVPVAPGNIIIWRSPASCGRHISTQFNPSTGRVMPRYLRPDAPVIYTGAFLIWQLGRGSICYICCIKKSDYITMLYFNKEE